jgi:SsrA-binding protein
VVREMAEKLICQNKKAFHNYFIEETYQTGVSLLGSEVKSLRDGKVNLGDSYGDIKRGEVFQIGRAHV